MRLRNITGSREVIAESPYVVPEDTLESCPGTWHEIFGNDHPIHIEIGMGKGRFLHTLAKSNPQINYVGIEKYSSVLLRAIQKMEEDELPNLKFIRMDAEDIDKVFGKGEVDRIYLNFSDPWPKDRHAKPCMAYCSSLPLNYSLKLSIPVTIYLPPQFIQHFLRYSACAPAKGQKNSQVSNSNQSRNWNPPAGRRR